MEMTKDQIIEKLMKENAELKEERDKFKRQYEKRRTISNDRQEELAKILCPHSNTRSYKDIKDGCFKLAFENEKLKYQINKQSDYVDTMEYETKIEQLTNI